MEPARRLIRLGLLSLLGAALLAGCVSASRRSRGFQVSDEEVYRQHCGSCHRAYAPTRLPPERWAVLLQKHPSQRRHRAPEQDLQIIAQYLGL